MLQLFPQFFFIYFVLFEVIKFLYLRNKGNANKQTTKKMSEFYSVWKVVTHAIMILPSLYIFQLLTFTHRSGERIGDTVIILPQEAKTLV